MGKAFYSQFERRLWKRKCLGHTTPDGSHYDPPSLITPSFIICHMQSVQQLEGQCFEVLGFQEKSCFQRSEHPGWTVGESTATHPESIGGKRQCAPGFSADLFASCCNEMAYHRFTPAGHVAWGMFQALLEGWCRCVPATFFHPARCAIHTCRRRPRAACSRVAGLYRSIAHAARIASVAKRGGCQHPCPGASLQPPVTA